MKKVLLFALITLLFLSCSLDDSNSDDNFYSEFVPIESVTIPASFTFNEVYNIFYTYQRPTTCHFFNNLYYSRYDDYRYVAVVSNVLDNGSPCEELTNETVESSFKFICTKETGSYIFKFWNGTDENGEDVYLIYDVPVVN